MSSYHNNTGRGYKLAFKKIYTLGDKVMWRKEVQEKRCGPVGLYNWRELSRGFYSEEDSNWFKLSIPQFGFALNFAPTIDSDA